MNAIVPAILAILITLRGIRNGNEVESMNCPLNGFQLGVIKFLGCLGNEMHTRIGKVCKRFDKIHLFYLFINLRIGKKGQFLARYYFCIQVNKILLLLNKGNVEGSIVRARRICSRNANCKRSSNPNIHPT